MNVYYLKYPTDIECPCIECGASNARRTAYCASCEDAINHEVRAEGFDVDASMSDDDANAFAAEQAARPSIAPTAPEAA